MSPIDITSAWLLAWAVVHVVRRAVRPLPPVRKGAPVVEMRAEIQARSLVLLFRGGPR